MGVIIKQVLSEGASNPVVARLTSQTLELLPWVRLGKPGEDRVFAVYFELTRRLLKIDQQIGRLMKAMEDADAELTAHLAAGRQTHLPQIVGIEGEVETFLYDAKNYLRTLLEVFDIFFDKRFDEASAFADPKGVGQGEIVAWAKQTFGADNDFTKMLVTEQVWIGDVIQHRNAVEHPGGKSGTLYIENVTFHPSGKMVLPVWWLNVGVGVNMLSDLDVTLCNLCTLAEDILLGCIQQQKGFPSYIAFYEIPVEQRDLTCPKRIMATIDHSKMKPPQSPPAD